MSSDFPVASWGCQLIQLGWTWPIGSQEIGMSLQISFSPFFSYLALRFWFAFSFFWKWSMQVGSMYLMLRVWSTGTSPPLICGFLLHCPFPLTLAVDTLHPPKKTACKFHLHICFLGNPAKKILIYISVSCLDSSLLCSPLYFVPSKITESRIFVEDSQHFFLVEANALWNHRAVTFWVGFRKLCFIKQMWMHSNFK